ncbi:dynein axonemal intermediate chain 4-like isoform X2 [Panulirus ornatus]|uniref:dynein axonemal intermediate chain 4-like isoform X2 n=1 Tax=Panulirus ornatus TaxID=150431 RepID=UPI003A89D514
MSDRPVLRVRLQETPTLLLYLQENTSVSTLDPASQTYVTQWSVYTQKREGREVRTREVTCQTLPKYYVDKTTQKSAVQYKDTGSLATQWDLYDEYEKLRMMARPSKQVDTARRRRSQPALLYYTGDADDGDEKQTNNNKKSSGRNGVCGVEVARLLRGLGWVERQLSSTENLHLLHTYTSGRRLVKEGRKVSMSSERASIQPLWQFSSARTQGRRVNCLTFCRTSPWLVVATYGELGFGSQTEGSLVGWNVKRVGQPELWLPLPGPATVISSCPAAPQLCCVALLDGTLLVYQLDTPTPQLVMDTSGSLDKHCSPVWAVEWRDSQMVSSSATKRTLTPSGDRPPSFRRLVIDMQCPEMGGSEIAYVLVSSSEDGTVKEWIFIKDTILCCTTLLKVHLPLWLSLRIAGGLDEVLRRQEVMAKEEGSSAGLKGLPLPKQVPATAMHFRPGDKTTYLVGTAAGDVLLCKTYERERCGEVYVGHSALVTKVAWRAGASSDEANSIFLSAALDDTIRVWFVDKPAPICVLRLVETAVSGGYVDACWCPWYGNLIAGVHGGGLHLWDISLSTHTPILTQALPGATCVTFSPHTRNVVVGDSEGRLSFFHLEGLEISASIFLKYSTKISKLAKIGVIPVD